MCFPFLTVLMRISIIFWSQSWLVSQSVCPTVWQLQLSSCIFRAGSCGRKGFLQDRNSTSTRFNIQHHKVQIWSAFNFLIPTSWKDCDGRLSDKVAIRNVCWWIVYHVIQHIQHIHYPAMHMHIYSVRTVDCPGWCVANSEPGQIIPLWPLVTQHKINLEQKQGPCWFSGGDQVVLCISRFLFLILWNKSHQWRSLN